jgi:hypothetical protein
LKEAQPNQTKYGGGKEVVFEVGEMVWLSAWHFRTTKPWKKLDYKWTGPYTVRKVVNKNPYKLNLLYTIWSQNVFQLSLFQHNTPPIAG